MAVYIIEYNDRSEIIIILTSSSDVKINLTLILTFSQEQEARTKLLRDRVHAGQEHSSNECGTSSILPYNEPQKRHINLFEEEESGTAVSKLFIHLLSG